MKKEDRKLKAALELKRKIEEDLGLEKKEESSPASQSLSIQASSYNLDFSRLTVFTDLYDFADFNISDERIADMMESHDFKNKKDFIRYLRKEYDILIESLKKRHDEVSMYNLFITLMNVGNVKEALRTALNLKNTYSTSPLGYLALSHVLFFVEDERWEDSFKIYLSMSEDKMASFVWEIFKGNDEVKFPRLSSRKYLLDIGMFTLPESQIPRSVLIDRICHKTYNPCGNAVCNLINVKNGGEMHEEKSPYCYLESYTKALSLYMKGEYSKALRAIPKIRDPNFLYFEGLCHYSLDEPDGFNAMIKEISKIDPKAFFFLSLSADVVKSFGLAEESSAIFRISPEKLGDDYHTSLRKLIFEFAKIKGYSPSRINFGMKIRRYHVMRMFFGYRTCKGVNSKDDKK
ncbi:hypothetical protein [Mesoaciditoga lauensis]|uniref:hypothetical protein n=1 Tax=Mesoaciditoga lauensis TaxID=1495039 RepID=UPI00056951F3|nr:hypothetical protein [Mesoaciditoga lauensis]